MRRELQARNLSFEQTDNWTTLLNILKAHEGDNKFFKPLTGFENFVTSDHQRPEDDRIERITFSRLRKNDNIEAVRDELRSRDITCFTEQTNWKDLLTLLKKHEGHQKLFTPCLSIDHFVISEPRQRT